MIAGISIPSLVLEEAEKLLLGVLTATPVAMRKKDLYETALRVANKTRPVNDLVKAATVHEALDEAVANLVALGKVLSPRANYFISRRHLPKIRSIDADWQW